LRYTSDWEMWQRIASQFSFWFEPSGFVGPHLNWEHSVKNGN